MHTSIENAVQALRTAEGKTFVELFRHGSMTLELYQPQGRDLQQPHEQDELYVVISGTGTFQNDIIFSPFGPGDVIFVPAGVEHRFLNFTDDFKTWVIFYGPKGGE